GAISCRFNGSIGGPRVQERVLPWDVNCCVLNRKRLSVNSPTSHGLYCSGVLTADRSTAPSSIGGKVSPMCSEYRVTYLSGRTELFKGPWQRHGKRSKPLGGSPCPKPFGSPNRRAASSAADRQRHHHRTIKQSPKGAFD